MLSFNLHSSSQAANLDIILGSLDAHEEIYDELFQIAPTVFTESLKLDCEENLNLHAEAIGKEEEAKKLITEYHNRLEKFREDMGDKIAETEVSFLRPRTNSVRIYLAESFSGKFIEEIDFLRPTNQQEQDFTKEVTEE